MCPKILFCDSITNLAPKVRQRPLSCSPFGDFLSGLPEPVTLAFKPRRQGAKYPFWLYLPHIARSPLLSPPGHLQYHLNLWAMAYPSLLSHSVSSLRVTAWLPAFLKLGGDEVLASSWGLFLIALMSAECPSPLFDLPPGFDSGVPLVHFVFQIRSCISR
jgi:hypothetical protein